MHAHTHTQTGRKCVLAAAARKVGACCESRRRDGKVVVVVDGEPRFLLSSAHACASHTNTHTQSCMYNTMVYNTSAAVVVPPSCEWVHARSCARVCVRATLCILCNAGWPSWGYGCDAMVMGGRAAGSGYVGLLGRKSACALYACDRADDDDNDDAKRWARARGAIVRARGDVHAFNWVVRVCVCALASQ